MKSLDDILSFLSGNRHNQPYLDETDIDVYYDTQELIDDYEQRNTRFEDDYRQP